MSFGRPGSSSTSVPETRASGAASSDYEKDNGRNNGRQSTPGEKPAASAVGRNMQRSPLPLPPLPLEWMDPMSWRLPSGKALAEFALQSGFLAPLLWGGDMGGIGASRPHEMKRGRRPGGGAVGTATRGRQ